MGTPFFPITLITKKLTSQGSLLSEKTIHYPYWFVMDSLFDRTVRTVIYEAGSHKDSIAEEDRSKITIRGHNKAAA